jgi:hypothetical protein
VPEKNNTLGDYPINRVQCDSCCTRRPPSRLK